MNGTNLFKIALRALANNKLRAFLTMLGIIIGVASVITMLAIGQGSKKSIQQQISEMGSNMIMIHPGADMRGGVRQDPSAMQTLKLADYEALRDETSFLSAISPNVSSSGQLIAGNNNYPASVNGVGTEYLDIRQLTVENGEMFTEADIQSSAKVCVIGKTIVDNLFPDGSDPVGKIIRFSKIPLRVVGVLKAKGYNSMGQDQDAVVLAPYTTVMKRLLAVTYLQGVFASALTEDMTDYATDEISTILRRNHKLKASDVADAKASALGDYLPNLLQLDAGETIIYMTATADYSGQMVFFFANGKAAKVPLSAYETKTNRRKLVNAYSARAELVRMAKIAEEADFMLMRNADKATLLNTELIPLSATKNAGGVQVFTLKKNSAVTAVFAKAEFETEEYEYYRTKKIPTTGHFIQEKDKTTNHLPGQMALGE